MEDKTSSNYCSHLNPSMPVPTITGVMSVGLCSFSSEVITFDQNWHHENAQKLERKLGEIFPLSTLYYSFVRIFCLDIILEISDLEASPKKGQQLQQKDEKRRKMRGEKNDSIKPQGIRSFLVQKQNFDFCAYMYLSKVVLKSDASGKRSMLSRCKCFLV